MNALATPEQGAYEPAVLQPGEQIAPGYDVVAHISRGSALDVYEVFSHERLCSCIAKTVRPDRRDVQRVGERLWLEGHVLHTLAHPHLPRAFEVVDGDVPVVILETMVGLTLEEIIDERARRLPAPDLAHLGRHLCSAMHYLHGAGYLHLDVRPANVIAHAGIATLIDLSIARGEGPVRRGLGTREYMAPEQARGTTVTTATDVWGLGATLFEAATAVAPFGIVDGGDAEVWSEGGFLQLTRPAPDLRRIRRRLNPGIATIIEQCLQPEPEDRPRVTEVYERLGDVLGESLAPQPAESLVDRKR